MSLITTTLAASAFLLPPFGGLVGLMQNHSSWSGFEARDPILYVGHIEKTDIGSCKEWKDVIRQDEIGREFSASSLEEFWGPWTSAEKEAIEDCDSDPCKVKLNSAEVRKLNDPGSEKSAPKRKISEYIQIVLDRASIYLKSGKRDSYEYPDPRYSVWAYFRSIPLSKEDPGKTPAHLWVRKLDFGKSQMKPLRQILDRRIAEDASGKGLTVWSQDVYTDHYFDSWGEYARLLCDYPKNGQVTVVQVLVVEFDLLKKTDLISRLARGKMRSAVKEQGNAYLNQVYHRIFAKLKASRYHK